jgi:DNA repair exonuclease SbcCD ATPase subunit
MRGKEPMGHLLGIRIQRYKALKDVVLGKHEYDRGKEDLPALTCLSGPNGSGKSTVLDVFGFAWCPLKCFHDF